MSVPDTTPLSMQEQIRSLLSSLLEVRGFPLRTTPPADSQAVRKYTTRIHLGPLPTASVDRFARALQLLLSHLDREIVVAALIGERKSDLLDAERQEVNRVREFLDDRIITEPVSSDCRRRCLTVLDGLVNEFEPTAVVHHSSPDVDDAGAHSVGDVESAGAPNPAPALSEIRDLVFSPFWDDRALRVKLAELLGGAA